MDRAEAWRQVELKRRSFMKASALGLMAFTVAGCRELLSPQEAREKGADLAVLTGAQAAILEAFGEALVPGARNAGIAHYIDANLARPLDQSLLMIRYLDVLPPFADFYRPGLAALDALARARHATGFADLDSEKADALVGAIIGSQPDGWENAPPAPFFTFVVRADAADVVYGTMAGYERLNVPYLAHIDPPSDW